MADQNINLQIRELDQNDASSFWQLRLQALREHPEAFVEDFDDAHKKPLEDVAKRFENQWNAPNNFILGAFIDEKLIGIVGFYQETKKKLRHKGMLWGMYVASEVRKYGIGRKLVHECIARAGKLADLEQINLTVATQNEPAKTLYQSSGFVTYGIETNELKLSDSYVDGEHMALALKKGC